MTGDEVREIRYNLGMSPPDLAKLMGVSRQLIYCWERGDCAITPRREAMIRRIALEFKPGWNHELVLENRRLLAKVRRLERVVEGMSAILAKPLGKKLVARLKKRLQEGGL